MQSAPAMATPSVHPTAACSAALMIKGGLVKLIGKKTVPDPNSESYLPHCLITNYYVAEGPET